MKKSKKNRNEINFHNFVYILALFLFVGLALRCAYLGLSTEVDGINLQVFASKRTTRKDITSAKRGTIYDKNGKVLAQNVYSYTLIAYLSSNRGEGEYVKDKETTAEALATVIAMEKEEILRLLNKDSYQTEFSSAGRGLTELTKEKIVALNLDGIDFIEDQKRYYPNQDFLSYTLGYAKNKEDGSIVGEMGLELRYNEQLTGTDGYRIYQKDLRGYKIAGTYEEVRESIDGKDIYLTIDADIQLRVEEAVKEVSEKYNFEQINIMVAEAKTGKILAVSTSPSFNPNKRDIKNYLDPNISVAIEPGSTMKIFSYMAVMESGRYKGSETFKSGIYTTTDGTEIGDWDRKGWGDISYDKGFALSSNVGVVNLINKYLSREELLAFYQKLGFGEKTGIELANEAKGNLDFKYETEVLNAGFGQGIMTTSIQNIQALTSIANDGMLLKPYLVEKIVDAEGNVIHQGKKEELRRVASKETINQLKDLMEDVIQEGTGSPYQMEGYNIIAKTGTAQIASENGTGYLTGKNDVIRGFAGIYPKDNPDIIIYANVKRPSPESATPLVKLVKTVIENVSKIRNNTEEKEEEKLEVILSSYLNKNLEKTKESLEKENLNVEVIGTGEKIIAQYPGANTKVIRDSKVFILTDKKDGTLANLSGWSKKEIESYCKIASLSCQIEGVGYGKSMNQKVGTPLAEIDLLEVKLEKKFEGE